MEDIKKGTPAPQRPEERQKPSKPNKIKIDGTMYEVDARYITGSGILELVHKSSDLYDVGYKEHGHNIRVLGLDERIDLEMPGVEKFVTIQKGHIDGEEGPKGPFSFSLTEKDQAFADSYSGSIELVVDGNKQWVLIHGMDVPEGYNISKVTAAVMLPVGYPVCGPDMVYFYPVLSLTSGKTIHAADARMTIQGKSYQRWSRHFTSQAPWRPDVDSLETYYLMIQGWLTKEVIR